MTEVERHFREHLAPKLIQPAGDNFTTTGFAVARHSAQLVQSLARRVVEELRRFPLPLVHSLSRELEGRTLHIFKAHENITYVSVARPKYLDRTLTPVSDSVQGILEYLEGHAQTPRPEQWKALVGLRPDPAEGAEDTRENALAGDLNWLLREGHAIDFAKRSLEAARPPKPRPEAKQPKAKDKGPSQKPAKAAPSMVESIPVNEPSVAPSTPSEESASAETSPLPISEGSEVEPALIPVPPVETETITAEAPALEETPVAVLPVSNPTIEATAQPALDETPQPAEPIATASPEASPETNQPTESNL
jgi:hypothetical protein